jgi:hypothetical protein
MIQANKFPEVFLAGKSRLTIKNPETGNHIKIRMRRKKDSPVYYLQLAILGDSDPGYRYAGAYQVESNKFFPAKDIQRGSRMERIASFLIEAVSNPFRLNRMEIMHEGQCCRCGRKLTHPESIQHGIGPECSGKLKKSNHARQFQLSY